MGNENAQAGSAGSSATASTTAGSTGTVAGSTSTEQKQYVTAEQFQAFQSELQKRLDGQSGTLGKLSDNLKPLMEALTPKQNTDKKEADTLKSLKEQMDAREARQIARERNTALNEALEKAGVPAERRSKAAKYILAEHDSKITQRQDGSFEYKENDTVSDLHDWIGLYLKTDDGKFINPEPAPAVPTGKGLAGSKGASTTNGAHPGEKMTVKELMDPKNSKVRMSYAQEHPEKWKEKQAEYFAGR